MSRINVDAINANEFALVYNWNLRIDLLPVLPGLDSSKYTGTNGILNVNCTSADLPRSEVRPVNMMIRGLQARQSGGHVAVPNITLNFVERREWTISKLFETWKDYIFDKTAGTGNRKNGVDGAQGYAVDYIMLELLTESDNDPAPQVSYKLRYAFPENVQYQQLGSEPATVATTTVTFGFATFEKLYGQSF